MALDLHVSPIAEHSFSWLINCAVKGRNIYAGDNIMINDVTNSTPWLAKVITDVLEPGCPANKQACLPREVCLFA